MRLDFFRHSENGLRIAARRRQHGEGTKGRHILAERRATKIVGETEMLCSCCRACGKSRTH